MDIIIFIIDRVHDSRRFLFVYLFFVCNYAIIWLLGSCSLLYKSLPYILCIIFNLKMTVISIPKAVFQRCSPLFACFNLPNTFLNLCPMGRQTSSLDAWLCGTSISEFGIWLIALLPFILSPKLYLLQSLLLPTGKFSITSRKPTVQHA